MEERRLGPVVGLGTWRTFGGNVELARDVVAARQTVRSRRRHRGRVNRGIHVI